MAENHIKLYYVTIITSSHQGNVNYNLSDLPLNTLERLKFKILTITSFGKDGEQIEVTCITVRSIKWSTCFGKQIGIP